MPQKEKKNGIDLNELVWKSYEIILENKEDVEDAINKIINDSGLKKLDFGWKLFEFIKVFFT